ncbi:hypothetical protein JXA32_13725, partial [Candidatus Sumerlaeota bacterium]|nr:hypothetical protein [Candidatus Sumerlaeota bacterium]
MFDGTDVENYAYDAYGNLSSETKNSTLAREYFWNARNQLIQAKIYNESGGALAYTLYFEYDDNGTRVSRLQTEGAGESNPSTTRFLTDYRNPTGYNQTLAETDAGGNVENQYTYGDSLLAQSADGGALFHADHLGSTRLLTDFAGAPVGDSAIDYTPYGDLLSGDGSLTSYQFTGQYCDELFGHQYHRERWLNTSLSGWCSIDPHFDFPINFGNEYMYAGQNPILFVDLTGGTSCGEISVVSGVAGQISSPLKKGLFLFQPRYAAFQRDVCCKAKIA